MRKMIRHRIFLLTVVITFVVITAAFAAMMAGREIIIDSEIYAAEKRMEDLSRELLKEYEYYTGHDTHVIHMFNERNQTGLVCAVEGDSEEILELHINFTQISLHEPISSLIPELNKIYEMDTEAFVAGYCEDNNMNLREATVSELSGEELFDMIEEIQEETGVQL